MFHQCFVCLLLVVPLMVADPVPLKSDVGSFQSLEHETLRMFEKFAVKFGRKYGSQEEYKKRYAIFKDNLVTIDRLNKKERGTARYGVTRFADLTYGEFIRNFTGGRIPQAEWERHEAAIKDEPEAIEFVDDDFVKALDFDLASGKEIEHEDEMLVFNGTVYLPKKYDYRKKKAVTPVKDQGECGSCWAFSAIANIEGVWAKKKKVLLDLSEQELVDCDTWDLACDGGLIQTAVLELVRLGGVAKTSDYPYKGKKQRCRFRKSMAAVKVAGTTSIPANEKKMARALIKNGPLSVTINASIEFMFYEGGVFVPSKDDCSSDKADVNHGVAFVAYGEEGQSNKKLPFWVFKNSWGAEWGEKGYMRIVRGKNACALTSYVSTAYL